MLPLERRMFILKKIHTEGKVTIDELSKELAVSGMTVRRDLDQLEDEGKVIRTHGGAMITQTLIPEISYSNKASKRTVQKRQIAKLARQFVPEGAKVLLDSGTTTLEVARELASREDLTIVTNDVKIAIELLDSPSHVILTGGDMQSGVGALIGPHAQHLLGQIRVDLLFLGAPAIHLNSGITAPAMDKALIKKMMIDVAAETWVVADSSKFGNRSFAHVCMFSSIKGIITDSECSEEIRHAYEQLVEMRYA